MKTLFQILLPIILFAGQLNGQVASVIECERAKSDVVGGKSEVVVCENDKNFYILNSKQPYAVYPEVYGYDFTGKKIFCASFKDLKSDPPVRTYAELFMVENELYLFYLTPENPERTNKLYAQKLNNLTGEKVNEPVMIYDSKDIDNSVYFLDAFTMKQSPDKKHFLYIKQYVHKKREVNNLEVVVFDSKFNLIFEKKESLLKHGYDYYSYKKTEFDNQLNFVFLIDDSFDKKLATRIVTGNGAQKTFAMSILKDAKIVIEDIAFNLSDPENPKAVGTILDPAETNGAVAFWGQGSTTAQVNRKATKSIFVADISISTAKLSNIKTQDVSSAQIEVLKDWPSADRVGFLVFNQNIVLDKNGNYIAFFQTVNDGSFYFITFDKQNSILDEAYITRNAQPDHVIVVPPSTPRSYALFKQGEEYLLVMDNTKSQMKVEGQPNSTLKKITVLRNQTKESYLSFVKISNSLNFSSQNLTNQKDFIAEIGISSVYKNKIISVVQTGPQFQFALPRIITVK